MKTSLYVLAALLLVGFVALMLGEIPWTETARAASSTAASQPDLEYLKAVNSVAPPKDPQLLFLLMTQYVSANLQAEGAEFFAARLKEFEPRLTPAQRSLYLSIIGLLRAQHAASVPFLRRYSYVKETLATLEKAKQLSGGQIFVVNWIAGIVHTEVPGFFGQRKAAQEELTWCAENAAKAPHVGWLREVYYHLAKLAESDGDQTKAQDYLRRSGYTAFDHPITLATPCSEEVVAGHFVVSEDRRELIGIDAGTRPDAAKTAYEALRAYAPGLPELTTVLITHAHWDHVGGHSYFRSLNPRLRFYGRSNYQEEVARERNGPGIFAKQFFGERFSFDDVRSYKPDVTIDRRTDLKIGGTRIELIPIQGGETHDAMFVNLPDHNVMFAGDFIMPYLGAPFVGEGDFDGLLDAIDVVVQRNPRYLLHGHEPLTRNFASPSMLARLKTDLLWLREQVLTAVRRGDERAAIHRANLIPPDLFSGEADIYQPYLILREHVIDRLYHQNVGYWEADLQGLDHLGAADRGELLVDYLGVSERQIVGAVDRMAADGKYELAASLIESSIGRFPRSESLARAKRLVYLKLMEKNQNTDPFKFIIYSGKIDEHTPRMPQDK